jgi:hypothetical protein
VQPACQEHDLDEVESFAAVAWQMPLSSRPHSWPARRAQIAMIRKLKDGRYRLYSRKKNPKTGKRRNLGTFRTRAAAEKHERAVQFFKRGG